MPLTDTTFDLTQSAPQAQSSGWTRTTRSALKDEGLVKFRENFVKKVIKVPLSSNLQVSSYKASEMDNKNNFFNAIASWSASSLRFEAWFRTHFVNNVFVVQRTVTVPGTGTSGPTTTVEEVGNLFKIWNSLTLQEVFDSCVLYMNFSTTVLEAVNLNLSWEFLMANIDEDLRYTIIAEVSRFVDINPDAAQSGPMAYYVIANRLIRATDSMAHSVVSGLMGMGLVHFKGENVVDAVSCLRNVLVFLGHGTKRSKTPPTLMDHIYDVFLRCSNAVFVGYIRNLRDFHSSTVTTPEDLFAKAQDYYNELLIKPNGWIRTTKNRAAFLAGLPELEMALEAESPHTTFHEDFIVPTPKDPKGKSGPPGGKGKGLPVKDRAGRVIDRTPPKDGKTKRTNADGKTEFYCSKCPGGRWGSHDDDHHDAWWEKYNKRRESKRGNGGSDDATTATNRDTENPSPSMHRATVARPLLSVFAPVAHMPVGDDDSDSGSF